ncbi:MAG: hypothetical protein ABEJ98_05190 [Candidatus Nanohaloarchaea archaeon]
MGSQGGLPRDHENPAYDSDGDGNIEAMGRLVELEDLDLDGNDLVDAGTVVWDSSQGVVPASQLPDVTSLSGFPLPASDVPAVTGLDPGTMASGEFLRFDGSSLVGGTVDLSGLRQRDLELLADIAENRYANSLAQENYDSVLFDVFVDSSKIASSSSLNVKTGQNGNMDLALGAAGTTASRTADDNSSSDDRHGGLKVNPNTNLAGIRVKVSANTGTLTEVGIMDSNYNVLTNKTGSWTAGKTVDISKSLSAGTTYFVYGRKADGSSYTKGVNNNISFPFSSTDIDIVDSGILLSGGSSFSGGDGVNFVSVTAYLWTIHYCNQISVLYSFKNYGTAGCGHSGR